jgi:hypothetical protein
MAGLAVSLAACGGQPIASGSLPGISSVAQSDVLALGLKGSKQNLLYVSSNVKSRPNLLVYTFPVGRFEKKTDKSPLIMPAGECADRRGHIYVTNQNSSPSSSTVLVYDHATTRPFKTLTVNGSAAECSVDRASGDLAVISSSLAVFRAARGKPTYYPFPKSFDQVACDYDSKGNLFVDGVTKLDEKRAALLELPAGHSQFEKIAVPPIAETGSPGRVRWDGKNVVVGDGYSTLYQLEVTGTKAKEVGTIQLYGSANLFSFWISDGFVVGSNLGNPTVMIWNYPGGGQPSRVLQRTGRGAGVAESVRPPK